MKLVKNRLLVLHTDRKPKKPLKVRTVDTREWQAFLERWEKCVECDIGRCATNHVFGSGVIPCFCLFIGEAPGKTEDEKGFPFIGKSGELLHKWINMSISNVGFYRWAITNTVLCRPCDKKDEPNRAPDNYEINNCSNRLKSMVHFAIPYCVVTLGTPAAFIMKKYFPNLQTLHLLHPSYVLRQRDYVASDWTKDSIDKLTKFIKATKENLK